MLRGSQIAAATAKQAVGRNFRNVMNGLVTQGLMYAKGNNVWRRTVTGHVVNNQVLKSLR